MNETGGMISQIGLGVRRLRVAVWGCITLASIVPGLLNAQAIPGYHLVSVEHCGDPLRSAHLIEENTNGQYGPCEGTPVTYRYDGLPSSVRYKVRAAYLSDTPDRVGKVTAGDIVVDGPFTEAKGAAVREFDVPGPAIQNGQLVLKFQSRVNSFELWSTSAEIAGNLLLTADGDDHGQIVGHVTNWLYEPAAGTQVTVQGGNEILSTRTSADGSFSVRAPAAWRNSDPALVDVRASHGNLSASAQVNSYEIYPPEIRLTPRPAKIEASDGPLQLDLGGQWNLIVSPPDGFWNPGTVPPGRIFSIQVPGEWAMQGLSVPLNGTAGYWHTIGLPAGWSGKRIKLKCDAAFSLAEVWVNGKRIGQYEGGFTPFEFDITDSVEAGHPATIALRMRQDTTAAKLSAMVNYAQHELGGISRKIYLFAVPTVNIAALHTETRFDDQYRDATLRINAKIANENQSILDHATLRFDITDPQGQRVPLRQDELVLRHLPAGGDVSGFVEIPVAAPQQWENEHPRLYTLTATLLIDGHATETIERHIGFRQVEMRGNQLLLNGHSIKLHGVERHETNPLLGRSLNPDIWRREVQLLHEANMNYVFTSHYPVPEEFLDLCDQAGILVTEEVPLVWVGIAAMNELADGNTNPKYYHTMATEASTLMEKDRDHPSIIFWQSCDECRWGRNAGALLRLFKATDPARPVNFSYEANTSMFFSQHYPSLDDARAVPATAAKGFLYDQYTHINNYNRREVLTDPGLRDYYGNAIGPMWDAMYANPGIIGGAIWEWSDDIFEVPPSGLDRTRFNGDFDSTIGRWKVGYGPWGIVDSWLRKKPEFWHVKKAYSPIRIREDFRVPSPLGGNLEIPVENRYDFTNLSEIRIEWSTAGKSGEATADVASRSRGVISLRLPEECADAKWLELKFFKQGELVDAYRFAPAVPAKSNTASEPPANQPGQPVLEQTGRTISVRAKNFYWEVDRATGMVTAGPSAQSAVIVGGPFLAITPAEMSPCCPQLVGATEPLQPMQMPWKVTEVAAREERNGVVVTISGNYPDASGTYETYFNPSGQATVTYQFQYNGPDVPVREIGLLFDVPAAQNTIRWRRKGLWSWYPEGHIGRMEGSASAFRPDQSGPRVPGAEPPRWPWEQDSTAAGTNDFRATKFNIFEASLVDSSGHGVEVLNSAARQSVRAWVDQTRIRLLVADFFSGGTEPFLVTNHYAALQRTLHKGEVLSGSATLALTGGEK